MTEDPVLSVALWSSVIQSAKREKCNKELGEVLGANANVCHVLKSKTLLHKLKQVVFYCVREISVNVWRKECREHQCLKESRGREELGKIICVRTRELGANEKNRITSLLSLDEWGEFKPQVRHICVEIADALLERFTQDIVAEMIQLYSAPKLWFISIANVTPSQTLPFFGIVKLYVQSSTPAMVYAHFYFYFY